MAPTGLIPWFSKTEGNNYATLLHHPFLFGENQHSAKRGSKKDFWRRCLGGLRKSQHTKYPSQTFISRITLFAICLSFSSPPLHPCRFIRPLSLSSLSFFICLFFACFLFARMVRIVVYLLLNREPKICGSSSTC